MDVKGGIAVEIFGSTVEAEFEDMDAQGKHGLALALIATALKETIEVGPDHANVVGSILARVSSLVEEYQGREVPVQYV